MSSLIEKKLEMGYFECSRKLLNTSPYASFTFYIILLQYTFQQFSRVYEITHVQFFFNERRHIGLSNEMKKSKIESDVFWKFLVENGQKNNIFRIFSKFSFVYIGFETLGKVFMYVKK